MSEFEKIDLLIQQYTRIIQEGLPFIEGLETLVRLIEVSIEFLKTSTITGMEKFRHILSSMMLHTISHSEIPGHLRQRCFVCRKEIYQLNGITDN